MKYQAVIGLEVHVQLLDQHQDLLRLLDPVRRRSPTPRPARSASACPGRCRSSTKRSWSTPSGPGSPPTAPSRRAASSPARTTSTPTSPRGTRSASSNSPSASAATWTSRWTGRRSGSASPASTWRRTPGKLVHADVPGLGDRLRRGPQPGLHAASGDRLRAGPAERRRGGRLPEEAPPDRGLPRHLRRQHGGGELPLRRQRLGHAGRLRPPSAPAPRPRTSTRSASSSRRSSTRSSARSR